MDAVSLKKVVEYRTSKGSVRIVGGLTRQAMQAGSSLGWVEEHAIKKPEDYRVVGHIFANIEVFPQYESAQTHIDAIGDDGVAAAGGPSLAASPMHMIQKEFLDPTQFFYHYRDHQKQMRELARTAQRKGHALAIGHCRLSTLTVLKESIPRLRGEGFE